MPHILIVDDHLLLLEVLRTALEEEHVITTARSGQEALAILEKKPVDLVITDFAMAEMTGVELIAAIRKPVGAIHELPLQNTSKSIPKIILYSACLHADLAAQALAAGADACLHKPFDLFELRGVIEKLLGAKK